MTETRRHGVSLYAQLAAELRADIAGGRWSVGDRLPTVAALAERYGVAVVTARQAIHMLVAEGLVTSGRGRGTFVSALPSGPSVELRSAINDPMAGADDFTIEVLQVDDRPPPAEILAGHHPAAGYRCFEKRHDQAGDPFCWMTIHIATDVLEQIPRGLEIRRKLNGLVLEYCSDDLAMLHTTTTFVPADRSTAEHLGCDTATPVARAIRAICDQAGRIVYGGVFWYRGDRFVLDSDVTISEMKANFMGPTPDAGFPHHYR